MAIKPTMHKLRVNLNDLDRNYFTELSLTMAQHPSETMARVAARLMSYCIHAEPSLYFCKGLSDTTEPAMASRHLDDRYAKWIEVGEPSVERVKKATRLADTVWVYSFNTKAQAWWQSHQRKLSPLAAHVRQFEFSEIAALAELLAQNSDLSLTISEARAFVAAGEAQIELGWLELNTAKP